MQKEERTPLEYRQDRRTHPRLLFTASEIGALCERSVREPETASVLARIREEAEAQLGEAFLTEEYANSVYSQHGRFYEIGDSFTKAAHTLGLLYCLTGERRYAEKLRDGMLHYASFRCWTGPANKDRDTPWRSDLSTTRILYAFAVAYDCIYDVLTEQERGLIRDAMLENGIVPLLSDWVLPGSRIHALDSMGHNWWSVCISLAGVGLCAIYEDVPKSAEWMEGILGALHGYCGYRGELLLNKAPNFDEKGLFYESAGYFNYGTGELARFKFVFDRLFGDGGKRTEFAHLKQAPQAFMSMSYPTSDPAAPLLFPNFGDSRLEGGFYELPMYLLLCGIDDPALHYAYGVYKKTQDLFDLLYPEKLRGKGSLKGLPTEAVFDRSGYAYLRTSWENDAVLLAVRCGYTWNHAHSDAGHFILLSDGAPVVSDSGNCPYNRPEYSTYYRSCEAHNVVTVNGAAQREDAIARGSKFPGTLSHYMSGTFRYLLADATGPTCDSCNRNYRSFLWLCPDLLLVLDELRANQKSSFASLLHCGGESAAEGDSTVRVTGKTPLCTTVLYPERLKLEKRTGYLPSADPDETHPLPEQPYYAFLAEEQTDVMQFMTLYGLHGAADCEPERIFGENQIGMEVSYAGDTYRVCFNLLADGRKMHENSNNCLLGFETDAYLLAVKQTASGQTTVLMAYGSYLRRDGRSLYESFTKDYVELVLS